MENYLYKLQSKNPFDFGFFTNWKSDLPQNSQLAIVTNANATDSKYIE